MRAVKGNQNTKVVGRKTKNNLLKNAKKRPIKLRGTAESGDEISSVCHYKQLILHYR